MFCRTRRPVRRRVVTTSWAFLGLVALTLGGCVASTKEHRPQTKEHPMPLVRIAELEIDPAHLDAYRAAVREEIETSVRVEPGVLAIHCVAERDAPTRLRFFEIYADDAAYRAHIASPHFQKYAATTKDMILAKRLIDTDPIQLSAKR